MKQRLDRPSEVGIAPPDAVVVALSNAPDQQIAQQIARVLVEERLAACVNILGTCESVYRWQGAIEQAAEVPLLIKTTRRRWAAFAARFAELHPYEVPELIAFAPDAILPAYSAWVIGETRESASVQPRGTSDRG